MDGGRFEIFKTLLGPLQFLLTVGDVIVIVNLLDEAQVEGVLLFNRLVNLFVVWISFLGRKLVLNRNDFVEFELFVLYALVIQYSKQAFDIYNVLVLSLQRLVLRRMLLCLSLAIRPSSCILLWCCTSIIHVCQEKAFCFLVSSSRCVVEIRLVRRTTRINRFKVRWHPFLFKVFPEAGNLLTMVVVLLVLGLLRDAVQGKFRIS